MLRDLLIGILIGLLAGTGGCTGPTLVIQSDRGSAVAVDQQQVRPVEYTRDDLQVAMETFAGYLATVVQQRENQLHVRLASADTDTRVGAYLNWCVRRGTPGEIMTANLIAFLGWDGFRNIIQGYRDMSKEVDAARTFQQVQAAGERYGQRMGTSMVRIVTALATWGLSATMGMARPVTDLPRGAQAVANAEAQGFRVLTVAGGSVTVSASDSVTLVLAAQATLPEQGGPVNQQHSTAVAPLKKFDIDKYGRFNANCRVGDELCGHEVLQNAWLREHGYAARRGADASRDNPAIAVDPPLHDRIAVEQRKLGLFEKENLAKMSAEENIQRSSDEGSRRSRGICSGNGREGSPICGFAFPLILDGAFR